MISNNVIISIIVAMLFCIIFPLATLIYLKRKEHFSFKTVFIGALGFVLFALILERILHSIVISSNIISTNTIGFAIYAALAAGIFEETGRFIIFKTFLKKNTQWSDGLGYGIGHGGIEAILIGGLTLLNSLVIAITINAGKLDTLLQGQAPSVIETVKSSITSITIAGISMGIFERIFALTVQIALTFVVLYAIKKRKNIYLLAAIVLHSALDFLPALYQIKLLTNLYIVEAIIFIFAIVGFAFILKSKKLFNNIS